MEPAPRTDRPPEAPVGAGLRLSPHLSWAEFIATRHVHFEVGQEAAPPQARANARRLALDVFEPARALVGPLYVSSGYRCEQLNRAVGGAPNSAHMEGRAVDVVPLEMDLRDAMARLAGSAIPFEKLIFEFGRWLHMQVARHGEEPNRRVLMAWREPRSVRGRIAVATAYMPWNPNDPRVRGVA